MGEVNRVGTIHSLKIDDILIGDRVRTIPGDIENLSLAMQIKGQLEPIIVDISEKQGKYNLIEGERRIQAAEMAGWSHIDAIMLSSLSETERLELEIMTCVHKKSLEYEEEARAVKRYVEKRRLEAQKGHLGLASRDIRNKEIAVELNMTESRMSENLKIAEAIEQHPELETQCLSRTNMLRKIRRADFGVPRGGVLQRTYEENFIIDTPIHVLESIEDKIIDLCILHPDSDVLDTELLDRAIQRLNTHGQIILFTDHSSIRKWEDILKERGLKVSTQPYIWAIKGTSEYQNYLWASKGRDMPIRAIPCLFQAGRPQTHMHPKAKPYNLVSQIIKCTTERGEFVVVPECFDIDTVRCCVEIGRNVRAGQVNKILRDKLIMSVVQG